jgi:glycosyltransferase involved in cell wall biosynthesis
MPKITVITPAYNCQDFIEESIRSILNQSYKDLELIVINDGSTDDTGKIIRALHTEANDERFRYIDSSENRGVSARSKEAIELARGEYIAIHDGDDISMSNRLEAQAAYLDSHADVFCVGGRAKKIGVHGDFIGDWDFPPSDHKEIVTMLAIYRKCPIINPTSMFRVADYKQLGGYTQNPSVDSAHDFDFWCRAILEGKKFHNLQDYLIKYRVNPNGMTRRNKLKQLSSYNTVLAAFLQRIKNVKL